jgi:hypothetical protein
MKIEIELDEFQLNQFIYKSLKESVESVETLDLDGDEDILKALKLVYMFYTGEEA